MIRARLRGPGGPWRVVFDGQSLNNYPKEPPGQTYPALAMSGRGIPWVSVAVDAAPWVLLANSAATRTHPLAGFTTGTVLVMCGGSTDIALNQTGQQVYDTEVAYAAAARAAGFTHIVGVTMTGSKPGEGNGGFTDAQDAQRLLHNEIMLADPDGAFDAVADVAAALPDASDNRFFDSSHIHYNADGAKVAAGVVIPVLDAILA